MLQSSSQISEACKLGHRLPEDPLPSPASPVREAPSPHTKTRRCVNENQPKFKGLQKEAFKCSNSPWCLGPPCVPAKCGMSHVSQPPDLRARQEVCVQAIPSFLVTKNSQNTPGIDHSPPFSIIKSKTYAYLQALFLSSSMFHVPFLMLL